MGLLFALFLLAFILFVAVTDLRAISAVKPAPKAARPFSPGGWTPGTRPGASRGPGPVPQAAPPDRPADIDQIEP